MKLPTPQFRIALTALGLLAGAAGNSVADIVFDPGTLYENRLAYVIDGVNHNFQLVYDNTSATPVLPLDNAIQSDGGSSSYSDSHVAVSNMNVWMSSGTTFDLSSTASAAILDQDASFAYAHAVNEYLAYFHVILVPDVHFLGFAHRPGQLERTGNFLRVSCPGISLRHDDESDAL